MTGLWPLAPDAIVTGCILSVGRIVGESAALLFTAGMANEILGVFESVMPNKTGSTLTVALYMYAKERGEFDIAFAIAVILLVLAFVMNLAAKSAARIADKTAFFLLGEIVEYDRTDKMFSAPADKRTENYITGRFG